jgi:hypothetical protein
VTTVAEQCAHRSVSCLNEFEFIRKYRCADCGGVMMCACDADVGRAFLPHQLEEGSDYGTRARVRVNLGFLPAACRECRGLPREAHPAAEIHGRTSKIKRYYWREIWFLEKRLFLSWATEHGLAPSDAKGPEADAARAEAAERALVQIKKLHADNPKYTFTEESQENILRRHSVEVVDLRVTYARTREGRRAQVLDGDEPVNVEEYVARRYRRDGWNVMLLESSPLHALFGVYMWLFVQDPADPRIRMVGTGDRREFDAGRQGDPIWFDLPEDFGAPAYGVRRKDAIETHLSAEMLDRSNLLWLFDYWVEPSFPLRNYLWAHHEEDVRAARNLVEVLPPATVVEILRYLVENYWDRYVGWPDLFVWKTGEFFFAEVKGSGDKLSEDQKRWVTDNAERLRVPFKLVKLHKAAVAG